jgi:DNA phosphorothioation-associated putative methyltransferase
MGLELLFASGDTGELEIACEETKLGWQDDQALYVHVSLLNELPPVLRAYVACAESLYGDASQADLVKLHKSSGKVTFLLYDDFMGRPLPQLRFRVKVNLRTRWTQSVASARVRERAVEDGVAFGASKCHECNNTRATRRA